MPAMLSNFFGSVMMRLTLVVGALAVMTCAAIIVAWLVFGSIVSGMGTLSQERLPELRVSAEVVSAANTTRSVLSEILIAADAGTLTDLSAEMNETVKRLQSTIDALPSSQIDRLSPMVMQVQRALDDLIAARNDEFQSAEDVIVVIAEAQMLAAEVNTILAGEADNAYKELVEGGNQTIASIDDTLTQLIENDFALYQATLGVQAEINLMTGLSLSMSQTRDPSMLSILDDLNVAAHQRLETLVAIIAAAPATKDLAETVDKAKEALLTSQRPGTKRLSPAEILTIRRNIDGVLAPTIDDIYFELLIRSEDAKVSNDASIKALLDGQVMQIREKAAMASVSKTFFASVMRVALAKDSRELAAKVTDLEAARDSLKSEISGETGALADRLGAILAIAEKDAGIVGTRAASFVARDQAALAARDAADAVRAIADEIVLFANSSQAKINLAASEMDAQVQQAKQTIQQIGSISVLIVLMAPFLIWMTVIRPLKNVTRTTERLAAGDLSEISNLRTKSGEIGRMAAALHVFRDGAIERIALQEEEKKREAQAFEDERTAEREKRLLEDKARRESEAREKEVRERARKEAAREEEIRRATDAERKARAEEQTMVVTELAESLRRLSEGDLSRRIDKEFPEAYEGLRHDYNAALANLSRLVGRISQSAESINLSSADIEASSLDLSRRTESSAATLEETAAALNELTASVKSAAQGASEATSTVAAVKSDTEISDGVMRDAVTAMDEIEQSSAKISKVVEVIDAIAFQTNLLALNAGVEAARAGEAGRGFAVVASEVRTLAQRCSDSAREINALISGATDQVERGVSLIDKASAALKTILQGVTDVSHHVSQIAVSANEQSSGIAEINTSVMALDRTTQQNAAMFEETTAASKSLSSEAQLLADIVAGFSVSPQQGSQDAKRAISGLASDVA